MCSTERMVGCVCSKRRLTSGPSRRCCTRHRNVTRCGWGQTHFASRTAQNEPVPGWLLIRRECGEGVCGLVLLILLCQRAFSRGFAGGGFRLSGGDAGGSGLLDSFGSG